MIQEERFNPATARLSPAIETRFSVTGKAGQIEGIAAGFGDHLIDSYGDTIAPGAFGASLNAHRARRTTPAMLWQHDQSEPIGLWTEVAEKPAGLMVKGQLNLDTQRGQEALALLQQGAIKGLSIGFTVRKFEVRKDGGRRITEAILWETSLVTIPARSEAAVTEIRSIRDLEQTLRNAGLPRAAATKVASGGWPALAKDPNGTELPQLVQELRSIAALLKG